jgi:hypothetical protein
MIRRLDLCQKNKRREKPFGKGLVSPSVLGKADYTGSLAMVKVTFLLNSYGDIIAEQ